MNNIEFLTMVFDQGSVFGFACGVLFMASFAYYFKGVKKK